MSSHPSYFELDRLALGRTDRIVEEHLGACDRCQRHIAAVAREDLVPAWVRDGAAPSTRWRWRLAGGALGTAIAAAAIVLLFITHSTPEESDYTTVKGATSVAVHIKRGGAVRLWDGRSVFRAGDAIRLEIAAGDYEHVTVFAKTAAGYESNYTELYQGRISANERSFVLPKAWELDDGTGDEVIVVVLSHAPIAAFDGKSPPGGWLQELRLPKERGGR